MKLLLFLFSFIVALLSISFSDPLISYLKSFTETKDTTASTTTRAFEGLPVIPPTVGSSPSKPVNMSIPRAIRKAFLAVEQAEGAGARVRRSIGTPQLRNFSPFLMLDHFTIKPGAGFPDHPHRSVPLSHYNLHPDRS